MNIRRSGVRPLPPTVEHVLRAAALPMHHRDPFDRLMVAQAQEDELTLLTTDARLAAYEVEAPRRAAALAGGPRAAGRSRHGGARLA